MKSTPTSVTFNVNIDNTISIPARSIKTIIANVSNDCQEHGDTPWMIEPTKIFTEKNDLLLARNICHIKDNKVPIQICNPKYENIILYQGMHAANIEPVSIPNVARNSDAVITNNYLESADINPEMSPNENNELKKLFIKYKNVFAVDSKKPGRTDVIKHSIITTSKPIKSVPYRMAPKEKEIVKNEISTMLENDVIRHSKSAWSAPIILVKKKDGGIRFCVDYRKLNFVTEKDVYPLPRIDDTLDKLGKCKYFTTLDLASGY